MSQTKAQLVDAVDGSIVDADIVGLTSSKLSGALPAISGASLTNLPAGGKILQVVTSKTTTEVTTSGQTYIDTGLSRTIQPTAANSSILIMLSQFFRITGSNANVGSRVQVLEGSNVAVASVSNDMYYFPGSGQSNSRNYNHRFNIISLHTPSYSLGDTLTYKSQMKSLLDGGATSTHAQEANGDSFLTLMEVAA